MPAGPLFSQTGFGGSRNAVWTAVSVSLDAFAGDSVRLLVEAAIDDVRVYQAPAP